MATALAQRPGQTAEVLRTELEAVVRALQSPDVVQRLEAIETLAAIEPKVKTFVTCNDMRSALAHRPGRTGDELRAEIEGVTDDLRSEDPGTVREAVLRMVDLEPKVRSFLANER